MTILHPVEIRDMTPAERQAELEDIETELLNAEALKATGGMPDSPGRITELRRTIARLKTIQREEGDHELDLETETSPAPIIGGGGSAGDEETSDEEASNQEASDEETSDESGGEDAAGEDE